MDDQPHNVNVAYRDTTETHMQKNSRSSDQDRVPRE
ncbi:hypothetical protein FHS96_004004 [Sphingomonas zeicaulis]